VWFGNLLMSTCTDAIVGTSLVNQRALKCSLGNVTVLFVVGMVNTHFDLC
jgi:hypothetical protein